MLLHSTIRRSNSKIPSAQSGAALLALMLVIIVGASYMLVSKFNSNSTIYARNAKTEQALTDAKKALLAYAMNYPELRNNPEKGPGFLPCPDQNNDGNPTNCGTSQTTFMRLGRLPFRILGLMDLRDSSGERLWYAVSDNFKNTLSNDNVVNSETPGLISVDGSGDIVAVIIAPGEPIGNQLGRPSNDPANYLDGINADATTGTFVTKDNIGFNDRLITISRQELMRVVEQRVIGEVRSVMQDYYVRQGVYPWLASFANPQAGNPDISGTATGGGGLVLNDDFQDFVIAGINVGDLVVNVSDKSVGRVGSIMSSTSLVVDRLDFGENNNFSAEDLYSIPRFNGTVGVRAGMLPFHTVNEAFSTRFVPSWFINSAAITIDLTVTSPNHINGMTSTIKSSEGTTSDKVSVDDASGACFWTIAIVVDCKGFYIDDQFISGSITFESVIASTSQCSPSNPIDGSGCLTLNDSAKKFLSAGVERGDLILNYSIPSGATINGIAEVGSGDTTLIDTTKNFTSLGVVPRTYFVKVTANVFSGEPSEATYIVQSVSENILTLIPLPGQPTILSENFEYSVYNNYAKGIVDSVSTDTAISIKTISGTNNLVFNADDAYRILIATNQYTENANVATNIANFIVYETSIIDFADIGIRVGDAVENRTHGGVGVITAMGPRIDTNGAWFTYTALKGGRYPDIFNSEEYRIHHTYVAGRRYELDVRYEGVVPDTTHVISSDRSRRRSVCVGYGSDCSGATLSDLSNHDLEIKLYDYDENSDLIGKATLLLNDTSNGRLKVTDIQYDLIESNAELPIWFVKNGWHKLLYFSYSAGVAPGAVATPCKPAINCLNISIQRPDGIEHHGDVEGIVIVSAGMPLSSQDRSIGDMTEYYENTNSIENTFFEQNEVSASFNDQIRYESH